MFISSMGRSPVSFEIDMAVASLLDAFAMIFSICDSSGIFGIFDDTKYFGLFHFKPCILT